MEKWPQMRIQRSKYIQCDNVVKTKNGFMFVVQGTTDIYFVEINADQWPPSCTCEDHYWRPDLLCKHIMYVLLRMGLQEARLKDIEFEPTIKEMNQIFNNANKAFDYSYHNISS